jgi:transcriptional regulator with XRE-family HTH domain
MPTDEELERRRQRRAWWLRVAREQRGLSQAGVADSVGLSKKSASTVGDWERNVSEPSLRQLELLAVVYDVPISLFIEPPETDEERFQQLAARAVVAAEAAAEGEPAPGLSADEQPGGEPHRRTA